jgi:hypothetical protein
VYRSIENASDVFGDYDSESSSDEWTSDSSSSCDSEKWTKTEDLALDAFETIDDSTGICDKSSERNVIDHSASTITGCTQSGEVAIDNVTEHRDESALEVGGLCPDPGTDVIDENSEKLSVLEVITDPSRKISLVGIHNNNDEDSLSDGRSKNDAKNASLGTCGNADSDREVSGRHCGQSDNDRMSSVISCSSEMPKDVEDVKGDNVICDNNSASRLPGSSRFHSADYEIFSAASTPENEELTAKGTPATTNQPKREQGSNSRDSGKDYDLNELEGRKSLEPPSPPATPTLCRGDSSAGGRALDLTEVSRGCNDDPSGGATTNLVLDVDMLSVDDIKNFQFVGSNESHQDSMGAITDVKFGDLSGRTDSSPFSDYSSNREGEGSDQSNLDKTNDENQESFSSYSYSSHNLECGKVSAVDMFNENEKIASNSPSQIGEESSFEPSPGFHAGTLFNLEDSGGEDDELMMAAALFAREEIQELRRPGENTQLVIHIDSDSSYESDSSHSDSHASAIDNFASDPKEAAFEGSDSFSSYDTYEDEDVDSQTSS